MVVVKSVPNILSTPLTLMFLFLSLLDPVGWADLAGKRPARLRVILNLDDSRKLVLANGITETMEQLMDEVRKVSGLKFQTTVPRQRLWGCTNELDIS